MPLDIFKNISLRRKRIAGLLLSEKALDRKDIIALNLELYAAGQAVNSAQRHIITEEIKKVKSDLALGKIHAALRRLTTIEHLIR